MERNGRATLRLRKSASPDARRLVHNFLPVLGALRGPERPNERAARRMADDSARKRGRLSGSPPPAAGSNAEAALAQARRELAAERARAASLEAELDALRNSSQRRVSRASTPPLRLGAATRKR